MDKSHLSYWTPYGSVSDNHIKGPFLQNGSSDFGLLPHLWNFYKKIYVSGNLNFPYNANFFTYVVQFGKSSLLN